jgi:hypothetical protein
MLASAVFLAALAAAPADCPARTQALKSWLQTASADGSRGAFSWGGSDKLVAVPFGGGSAAASQPVATELVVTAAGVDDAGKIVSLAEAPRVIAKRIERAEYIAQYNPHAAAHGVLVAAEGDAPAESVQKALAAVAAQHEEVWLVFRPSDGTLTAPPKSKVSDEVAKLPPGDGVLAGLLKRELGGCPGMADLLSRLGQQSQEDLQWKMLVEETPQALEKCACDPAPETVASIWWAFGGFRHLAIRERVPAERIDALPWGKPDAHWSQVAPEIVKALRAAASRH